MTVEHAWSFASDYDKTSFLRFLRSRTRWRRPGKRGAFAFIRSHDQPESSLPVCPRTPCSDQRKPNHQAHGFTALLIAASSTGHEAGTEQILSDARDARVPTVLLSDGNPHVIANYLPSGFCVSGDAGSTSPSFETLADRAERLQDRTPVPVALHVDLTTTDAHAVRERCPTIGTRLAGVFVTRRRLRLATGTNATSHDLRRTLDALRERYPILNLPTQVRRLLTNELAERPSLVTLSSPSSLPEARARERRLAEVIPSALAPFDVEAWFRFTRVFLNQI